LRRVFRCACLDRINARQDVKRQCGAGILSSIPLLARERWQPSVSIRPLTWHACAEADKAAKRSAGDAFRRAMAGQKTTGQKRAVMGFAKCAAEPAGPAACRAYNVTW
jgi:hypothetical protein